MPLIQWYMLNLEESACFIESDSTCTATGRVATRGSCVIVTEPLVTVSGGVIVHAHCSIVSDSNLYANGTVRPNPTPPTPPQPPRDFDLAGTFSMVGGLRTARDKICKYIEIEFTYKGSKYHSEFYSGKEIAINIDMDSITMECSQSVPTVSLTTIRGLHGKTHDLQK